MALLETNQLAFPAARARSRARVPPRAGAGRKEEAMFVTYKGVRFVVEVCPTRGFLFGRVGGLTYWADTMHEVCRHIRYETQAR